MDFAGPETEQATYEAERRERNCECDRQSQGALSSSETRAPEAALGQRARHGGECREADNAAKRRR